MTDREAAIIDGYLDPPEPPEPRELRTVDAPNSATWRAYKELADGDDHWRDRLIHSMRGCLIDAGRRWVQVTEDEWDDYLRDERARDHQM